MEYKLLKGENLVFGLVWGVIAFFAGALLTQLINLIDLIMGKILEFTLLVFMLPVRFAGWIPISSIGWLLAIVAAILMAPIAKVIWDLIVKIFKKNPV